MENSKLGNSALIIKSVVIAIVLVFLFFFPLFPSDNFTYIISVLTQIFLYMALAQMWNLLAGYAGLASLGQQTFVGVGAYTIAVVSQKYGMPIIFSIVLSIIVAVIFGAIISLPIFKMRGVYFTIGTWIIAEALLVLFTNWAFMNYATGITLQIAYRIPMNVLYWSAMGIGVGSVVLVFLLLRSKLGLALMSIRDNESAAEVRGIKLYKTKLTCFLIAAAYTAITGGVMYLNLTYVKPSSVFGIDWTVGMVFMVVIGGIGTIEGPILGAIIYVILRQWLYNFPGISMIILGALATAIILLAPKGVLGGINDRFGIEFFSVRRKTPPPPQLALKLADVLGKTKSGG